MVTLLLLVGCPVQPEESGVPKDTDSGDSSPDLDDDADGYVESEDCDDHNAYVYPGAKEYCDGVDQDCDGDPLAEGVCGEPAFLDAAFVPFDGLGEDAWTIGSIRDVTGNGVADFMVPGFGSPGRVYDSTELGSESPVPSVEFTPDSVFVSSFLDPGDVTGDGLNDVVMVEQYAQKLYVFHAPLSPTEDFYAADAEWSIGSGFDDFCTTVNEMSDLDLDGRADLACSVTVDGVSTTRLFLGTDSWDASTASLGRGSAAIASLGDVDGDGGTDVASISSYGVVVFPASRVAAGASIVEGDYTVSWPVPESPGIYVGDSICAGLGDQDGDGYDEFYVGLPGIRPAGAMYFFDGPISEIDEMDDAAGVLLGPDDEVHQKIYGGLGQAQVLRRDNDPLASAILTDDSGSSQHILIPAEPPSGVVEITDWPHVLFDTTWEHGPNTTAWRTGADVTGDGLSDFSAGREDTNQLGFVAGFVPPWDDPYYW